MIHRLALSISLCALMLCNLLISTAVRADDAPQRTNFSLLYTVTIPDDPRNMAKVQVELLGANEISEIVWKHVDPQWFKHVTASGRMLHNTPQEWSWFPESLSGQCAYDVVLNRLRNIKGFDSYHGGTWVLTRTADLFPTKRFVHQRPLRALTRVHFVLPTGWSVVSAMRSLDETTFEARDRGNPLTAPYGWLLIGKLNIHRFTVADVAMTVASPEATHYDDSALIDLVTKTIAYLQKMVHALPEQITIVVGPDPLWRGGLSGEDSLYLNQNLRLIASDYTSTAVHELFHLAQGFHTVEPEATWIAEGMAEYYSLKILRKIHALSRHRFVKGIRKFDEQALWHRNFLTSDAHEVLYNAAPLVFFYFDELIQESTAHKHSLQAIVKQLHRADQVSTKALRELLEKIAPTVNWKQQIQQYVIAAKRPPYEKFLARYERSLQHTPVIHP